MTQAPTPGGPSWQQQPAAQQQVPRSASSSFFRWIRGLDITRSPDRWVGGVSGGVARRTGLDVALVRGLILVLAVFGGIGVFLYGLAWALLPEPDGRIHVEQAGRGSWTSGLTGAAVLVAIGLSGPNLGDGGDGGLLWALFWIGAVVLFVYWIVHRSGDAPPRPGAAGTGRQAFEGPDVPADDADRTAFLPTGQDTRSKPPARTYPLPYQPGQAAWSDYASAYRGPALTGPGAQPDARGATVSHDRPARPSGSATALLIGGAIIIAAVLIALDYAGVVAFANAAVVALAAAAVVLALGVVALGVRGRSSGLVGLTAALAITGALLSCVTMVGGAWIVTQEARTVPASLEAASDGYSILAADATIDLQGLPAPRSDVVVPVTSLVSDVTVIVPDDVPVEVRTRMALGTADVLGTSTDSSVPSPEISQFNTDATGATLILDVRGALSEVTVLDAPSSEGSFTPLGSGSIPTGDTP